MLRSLMILLLVTTISGCAAQALTSGRVAIRDDSAARETRFSAQDRTVIQEFYRGHRQSGNRPASTVVRNEPAPAALAGRTLPAALEQRLSPLPAGVQRRVYGRDVALIQARTRLVLDVIHGVAVE